MSVARSGGRWAGLTEAKRAWARSLGGSGPLEPIAPSDRGPRTADRERKRPRLESRALFSGPAQKEASGPGAPAALSPRAGVSESSGREGAPKQGSIACGALPLSLCFKDRLPTLKR